MYMQSLLVARAVHILQDTEAELRAALAKRSGIVDNAYAPDVQEIADSIRQSADGLKTKLED